MVFWSSTAQSFWFVVLPERIKKGIFKKTLTYSLFFDSCESYLYEIPTNSEIFLYAGVFLFPLKKKTEI